MIQSVGALVRGGLCCSSAGRRFVRVWSYFVLLACLARLPAAALEQSLTGQSYVQTGWTDQNGLPQNSVYSIAQTTDGYMWFGTEEGIVRFDGVRFTVFNALKNKELKDSYVGKMVAGRDDSLWIGTRSGLTRFRDGVFRNYLSADHPITALYESHKQGASRIWIGSLDGLYSVAGDEIRQYTSKDGLLNSDIRAIAEDDDGTMWFGTAVGLMSLEHGAFRMYTTRDGLPGNSVTDVALSHDGSLWIATAAGLVRWKERALETVPASRLPSHARIESLIEDHDDTLWIGFNHAGLAALRDGKLARFTTADGLPSNEINQVYEDREGHLWIGLLQGGVVERRRGLFHDFGKREGLSENLVWSVLEAHDESLWVGTNDTGLNHIDKNGKVRVYTLADGLPDNTIFGLWEDTDQSLWTGSERGVLSHLWNGKITQYHDPESRGSRLGSIVGTGDGSLWLGFHSENGLARFKDGHFYHYPVPGLVNTLTTAPDGSLWVATDHGGVSRFQEGRITTYTAAQGLLSNFALAVYVDRDGVAWVGTSPGGLNRIKDGKITTYSVEQGLFDMTVGAIVEDDEGNLWMTCNKGIFRVSKKELNDYADGRVASIHSIVYGIGDGLRSAEFNFGTSPAAWKGAEGRLWFPTVAGIVSIDPAHSQLKSEEPKVAMEEVRVDGHEVMPEGGITAGPGAVDLEIQFTAPNFTAPERTQFRYRLRGFDPDWVNVGNRRAAYYTKLPPGQYVFMVQGANSDGVWSTDTATLEVTIKPWFWETWWFRLTCAVGLLLAGLGVFRLRVRYLVRRNHELEERVNQRTKELQEAIKAAEAAREALRELAMRDALTKLWNRHAILEILGNEASRAQREGTSLCILMADLDDFKQVNDTHGHLAGDCVLKEVALRFTALMRSYDSVGRYGGEELLIVLPGCSLQDGLNRAEEFRCAMVEESISVGAKTIFVSCSFGVSAAAEWASADRLIAEADEALYAAKHAGRNRVHSARECPA